MINSTSKNIFFGHHIPAISKLTLFVCHSTERAYYLLPSMKKPVFFLSRGVKEGCVSKVYPGTCSLNFWFPCLNFRIQRNFIKRPFIKRSPSIEDGAYYCYWAYGLCISKYSDFLSVVFRIQGYFCAVQNYAEWPSTLGIRKENWG